MPKRAKSKSAPKPAAHTPPRPLDVTVLLLDAGYASTAIAPIEVFHSAGFLWNWLHGETQEPRFRVRVASIDGKPVTTAGGVGLLPGYSLADIKHTDIIILPASGWDLHSHIAHNTALLPWLRKWHKRGAYIAGICTGVVFLAEAGLLDGKRATTHWYFLRELRKKHPSIQYAEDRRLVVDGARVTTTGISASMPMMLTLIEAIAGRDKAEAVAKDLGIAEWDARHDSDAFKLTRPFAATVLHNLFAFWNWEKLGIALSPGMDEVSLALAADAWSRTYRSRVVTFADKSEAHESRNGARILPDEVAGSWPPGYLVSAEVEQRPAEALEQTLDVMATRYGPRTAAIVAMQLEYPRKQPEH